MAVPTLQETGAGAASVTATLSVPFPVTGLAANDKFVLVVEGHFDDAAYTTPAGWTLEGSQTGGGGTATSSRLKGFLYTKDASGSETGNLTVTRTDAGFANGSFGRMYRFRGTGALAIENLAFNGTTASGTAGIVTAALAATGGADRIAVAIGFMGDDNTVGAFTNGFAESDGGEFLSTTGGDAGITLQTQNLVTAGSTIAASTATMAASDMWASAIFALYVAGGGTTSVSGSDSATGTDDGTVSASVPGSQAATGTDAGTVSVTLSSSDSGTGTDAQTSLVIPVAGSDAATGTDTTGAVSVTAAGSDSGTGTDAGSMSATGSGGETGTGSDAGSVSATVTGADTATGTDDGTVVDLGGGGPTLVSDSDSGTGSESGTVVDLTPPAETGPTGGAYEPGGDESSISGDFRALTGSDSARAFEFAFVSDLTPAPSAPAPRIVFSRRPRPVEVSGADAANGMEDGRVAAVAASADAGRAVESGTVEKWVRLEDMEAAVAAARAEADDELAVLLSAL